MMLVVLTVHNVGSDSFMTIAVDPWKVQYIRPVYMEEDTCYLNVGDTTWRVNSSFEDLVNNLNAARKETNNHD